MPRLSWFISFAIRGHANIVNSYQCCSDVWRNKTVYSTHVVSTLQNLKAHKSKDFPAQEMRPSEGKLV